MPTILIIVLVILLLGGGVTVLAAGEGSEGPDGQARARTSCLVG